MRAPLTLSSTFAAVLVFSPCLAQAEPAATSTTAPAPAAEESHRELNGHVFMPSRYVESPFSTTSLAIGLVGGAGEANTAEYEVNPGPPVTITPTGNNTNVPMAIVGPSLDLSVRILEWVSLRGSLLATVFTGTSGEAALIVGSAVQMSAGLGATAGLRLLDSLRLAVTLDYRYAPSFNILVLQGLLDIINTGTFSGSLFERSSVSIFNTGLAGAWALFPFLGLTLDLQYVSSHQSGQATLSGLGLAVLADFDLLPLVSFLPLGVTASYRLESPIGGDGVWTTNNYAAGLFYTGRRDLGLGLEVGVTKFRLREQQVSSATIVSLTSRYYW